MPKVNWFKSFPLEASTFQCKQLFLKYGKLIICWSFCLFAEMLTYLEFASLGQLQGAMQGKVQLEDWRSEQFDQEFRRSVWVNSLFLPSTPHPRLQQNYTSLVFYSMLSLPSTLPSTTKPHEQKVGKWGIIEKDFQRASQCSMPVVVGLAWVLWGVGDTDPGHQCCFCTVLL